MLTRVHFQVEYMRNIDYIMPLFLEKLGEFLSNWKKLSPFQPILQSPGKTTLQGRDKCKQLDYKLQIGFHINSSVT